MYDRASKDLNLNLSFNRFEIAEKGEGDESPDEKLAELFKIVYCPAAKQAVCSGARHDQLQMQLRKRAYTVYDQVKRLREQRSKIDIEIGIIQTRITYNVPVILNLMNLMKQLGHLLAKNQAE